MLRKSIFFLLLIFLSFTLFSQTVKITTLADYNPFCFSKDGTTLTGVKETIPPGKDSELLQGYSWDIVRESYHAAGITIELTVYPWSRAMNMVETGKVDLIFPASKTKEREEKFQYSKVYVNQDKFLLFVRNDSQIQWNGIKNLSGLRVAEMNGWNFGEDWNNNKNVEKVSINKIEDGFKLLDLSRVEAVIGYEIIFGYILQKNGTVSNYKRLPPYSTSQEFLMGLKNDSNIKYLDLYYDGWNTIDKSGKLKKIYTKWGTTN